MSGASDAARGAGAVPAGWFRVVVLEADGRFTVRDFAGEGDARAYANDAASECDGPAGSPFAYIFDDQLRFVDDGHHYATLLGPGGKP